MYVCHLVTFLKGNNLEFPGKEEEVVLAFQRKVGGGGGGTKTKFSLLVACIQINIFLLILNVLVLAGTSKISNTALNDKARPQPT